ncbi:unnamed protein product [Trifolium pratense]|uniref:Uncharacterized protein n=1 Tax=Trifolium pratense TaxID=57577 RepID=A0ACB0KCX4_TRIPR|nr:unnamed protein product [Trifolium pratense]
MLNFRLSWVHELGLSGSIWSYYFLLQTKTLRIARRYGLETQWLHLYWNLHLRNLGVCCEFVKSTPCGCVSLPRHMNSLRKRCFILLLTNFFASWYQ